MHEEIVQAMGQLGRLALDGVPGCTSASVTLLQEAGSVITLVTTDERARVVDEAQYHRGDGPCLTAMREQHPNEVTDYRTDPRWPAIADQALEVGLRSTLSVPLVSEGRTIGGLNLYGSKAAAFDETSLQAAEIFTRQAVMLLGYLQQVHAERYAAAREREVAATLQRSLLPTLPVIEGITTAARYAVSASQNQVGGDWYDVFLLPDGAIGFAVGDVMGHDVAAAAAMGQLRSVLRSYAYEGSRRSVVLDRLDRLVQGFDMAEVATAIYGRLILDRHTGTLVLSNAGHLTPVIRLPDGSVTRLDRGVSPLIGALPSGGPPRSSGGAPRSEAGAVLPAGSLLLLYTDGLVESRDRDIDQGIDALCQAVAALESPLDPERVCDELLALLGGSNPEDDVAILAIRIDAPD